MKEPKVTWVDSWRDIPCKNPIHSLHGWSDPKTGEIYAIRGVTSKADVEHEKYHTMKRHPDKPRNYRDYALQEIEATKYSYDKVGQPAHIKEKLRGIINDMMPTYEYNVKLSQIIESLKDALDAVIAPKTWYQDLNAVEIEARKKCRKEKVEY